MTPFRKRNRNQTFVYPPVNGWQCPECGKRHSKVHYAFENQIDFSKKPGEEGRVKFDREWGCGSEKGDTEHVHGVEETGPDIDKETGLQNPIFCSHCGWVDTIVHIVKNVPECCIRGCQNAVTHDKHGKYPTCDVHAGIVVGGHPEGSE